VCAVLLYWCCPRRQQACPRLNPLLTFSDRILEQRPTAGLCAGYCSIGAVQGDSNHALDYFLTFLRVRGASIASNQPIWLKQRNIYIMYVSDLNLEPCLTTWLCARYYSIGAVLGDSKHAVDLKPLLTLFFAPSDLKLEIHLTTWLCVWCRSVGAVLGDSKRIGAVGNLLQSGLPTTAVYRLCQTLASKAGPGQVASHSDAPVR
jgi:hypothetical protein